VHRKTQNAIFITFYNTEQVNEFKI